MPRRRSAWTERYFCKTALYATHKESPAFSAEFLQSHPLTGKRAANFEAAFDPHAHYMPALAPAQWDALFDICRNHDKQT